MDDSGGVTSKRVLVVDDEPGIRKALTRLFTAHGYEVRVAANGIAAEALLDEVVPDVVVSDFKMEGMNGIELLRRVAVRFPDAKRILLTGYAEVDEEPGVTVIAKPYDREVLLEACR